MGIESSDLSSRVAQAIAKGGFENHKNGRATREREREMFPNRHPPMSRLTLIPKFLGSAIARGYASDGVFVMNVMPL